MGRSKRSNRNRNRVNLNAKKATPTKPAQSTAATPVSTDSKLHQLVMTGEATAIAAAATNENVGELSTLLLETLLAERATGVAGCEAVAALVQKCGIRFIATALPVFAKVIDLASDKKSNPLRKAAAQTAKDFLAAVPVDAMIPVILGPIVKGGLGNDSKWQSKVLSLELLIAASESAPRQVESIMTELVPVVSEAMWDTKKQIKEVSLTCMEAICATIDNIDLKPFIPELIDTIIAPEETSECVYALAGTTFVQTVTASALSITVPILGRGFQERKTAVQRKCAVITENLAKLVKRAADVMPFMPVLEPALKKGKETISDPECAERFAKAHSELLKAAEGFNSEEVVAAEEIQKILGGSDAATQFASEAAAALSNFQRCYLKNVWEEIVGSAGVSEKKLEEALAYCKGKTERKVEEVQDDDDGEDSNVPDLCDLHFSLAYGSHILLNDSRLHLKKGYKYGIIANKSAGKTTMMRAIANGQVEGFPTQDEVRSIFIENDIQGRHAEMNVAEYICDTIGFGIKISIDEAKEALKEGGFTDVMCNGLITQLSGGWKMKLALIRATLEKADIMLMDEPTNHLDVLNVQWVVDYINSLPDVTCLMVSHDTGFLDKTVDHIIHFDDLKLKLYKGNISAFVERFPEAKSYFDLSKTTLKFSFPKPTPLQQGSKTNKGRTLMEMKNVTFTYPGAAKPQINNVNVKASMASRVAIVGANGAGKSTMIKLLTGELKPGKGEIKQHPNCRFAYVAQHAFHHIEQHLSKSPSDYLCWRYEFGEDKEADNKVTLELTEEEEKLMAKPIEVPCKDANGNTFKEKRKIEKIVARRKDKKSYVYECKFFGKRMDDNIWYPRDFLARRGFTKMMLALDARLAAAESMQHRPLTRTNVTAHLKAVGLDDEEANHSRIMDLSGGQKVKVVLAACTWACPHLIILDEPTNYLDRDSLGALAKAIDEFEGGVVLITHNKEFADATTRETWVVANNKCDVKGDPEWEKYAAEVHAAEVEEEETDAFGNKVTKKRIPKISEMSRAEIRQNKKMLKAKIKRGEELEIYEIQWCETWKIKWE
eukprot:g2864.t1